MKTSAHHLADDELGKRLRIAREKNGATQARAAEFANMSRTTLVAIEKGDRPVRDAELIALIDYYGVTMNEMLRREAVYVNLVPRFRKLSARTHDGGTNNEIDEAVSILNHFVAAEIELETILGIERTSNLPPERPLLPGNVRQQAESDALELRLRMGLGQAPVHNVFSLLELDLGVRVYAHRLDSHLCGLFAHDDDIGACILVNANHRTERQVATATHELAHIIGTRRTPDVRHDNLRCNTRGERYASAFSAAFLMPERAVKQKLSEICVGSKRLTRRHAIILAHYFGVSPGAPVRRLEALGLAKKGTWGWFQDHGGITDEQAEEVLGTSSSSIAPMPTSVRLETLAAQALARGLLSEGQVVNLLKIDRRKARRLRLEGEDNANASNQLSF